MSLLRKPDLGFSVQVMQEYFNVAYTKARLGITIEMALENLELLACRTTLPTSPALVVHATRQAVRFKISCWDAAIIAAAQELGCHTLYSEDLNHGQNYDGVRVVNPFI